MNSSEYYKVFDTFFGDNFVCKNIPLALEMAANFKHSDTQWLVKICNGRTKEDEVKEIFVFPDQNDARALCFSWKLFKKSNLNFLYRSAELGFAYAQGLLAGQLAGRERFKFAKKAAEQGHRSGFIWLAVHYRDAACDLDMAKKYFLLASELGHLTSTGSLALLFDDSDPKYWHYLTKSAIDGDVDLYIHMFKRKVVAFDCANSIFCIGRTLHKHVNEEAETIFGIKYLYDDSCRSHAKKAIAFYKFQIAAYRRSVDEWTKIGLRLGICKDIRKLIGTIIWETREEALFK